MAAKAGNFKLQDQDGNWHKLSDYAGRKVLLYFYPKDMTPGCTTEAKCFRDKLNDLEKHGVQVLGVSADDIESHFKFADKHGLKFPLLADIDKEVCEAYGVLKEKSMFGKKYIGINRESFLIGENGEILKHYEKVNPAEHVDEILSDLATMSQR